MKMLFLLVSTNLFVYCVSILISSLLCMATWAGQKLRGKGTLGLHICLRTQREQEFRNSLAAPRHIHREEERAFRPAQDIHIRIERDKFRLLREAGARSPLRRDNHKEEAERSLHQRGSHQDGS